MPNDTPLELGRTRNDPMPRPAFPGRKTRALTAAVLPVILLSVLLFALPRTGRTAAPQGSWWNTGWQYRRLLTVSGSTAIDAGYTTNLLIDTALLVAEGKFDPAGDDLRIAYWDGTSWTELDRLVQEMNTDHTRIWFRTVTAIADEDDNYTLYYGNPWPAPRQRIGRPSMQSVTTLRMAPSPLP